jgi:retinol dehydrogenase 12
MDFARRSTTPPRLLPARLRRSIWRQSRSNPRCPSTPRLDGKLALVTGGNAGIGLEISRGLVRRGAELVIAARNPVTSRQACETLSREAHAGVRHLPLDLADLDSIVAAAKQLSRLLSGRAVDILVANAGVWPQQYSTSAQGHEIAFATNTLGHHVLIRRTLDQGLLLDKGRVVVLTGDIYIRANECSSEFEYRGARGGALAYSRSKLGNLWFMRMLQQRYPALQACAVHPGVIDSGLGGESGQFASFVKRKLMLDVEAGAQAPLWCATQPIERGAYYHNTMGRIELAQDDPAADDRKAEALWQRLEALSPGYA